MDLIRSTGVTQAVLVAGQAPQTIIWSYCLPGSDYFRGLQFLGSSAWDFRRNDPTMPWDGLGEVPGAGWAGMPHYWPGIPVGVAVDGDPAWFGPGGPPADAPPLALTPWGVPQTCAIPVDEANVYVSLDIGHAHSYDVALSLKGGMVAGLLPPAGLAVGVPFAAALPVSISGRGRLDERMDAEANQRFTVSAAAQLFAKQIVSCAESGTVVALARLVWYVLQYCGITTASQYIHQSAVLVLTQCGVQLTDQQLGRLLALVDLLSSGRLSTLADVTTSGQQGSSLGVSITSAALVTPPGGCGSLPYVLRATYSGGTGAAAAWDGVSVTLQYSSTSSSWNGAVTLPGEQGTTSIFVRCASGAWMYNTQGTWTSSASLSGTAGANPHLTASGVSASGPYGTGTYNVSVTQG